MLIKIAKRNELNQTLSRKIIRFWYFYLSTEDLLTICSRLLIDQQRIHIGPWKFMALKGN